MKAFSTDLREHVVTAYDSQEGTQQQLADRFRVSVQWVRKVLRQRRDTGSIDPKPHGGGRTRLFGPEASDRLRQAVVAAPDATLAELARASGVAASPSMVHRALTALGITRKKSRSGPPSKTART